MRQTEKVWIEKWKKKVQREKPQQFPMWDFEYELMHSILIAESVVSRGKVSLELGSGTGRMSLKLGHEGAAPILLDVSRQVIKFSKQLAHANRIKADFIVGSILCLPLRSSCVDLTLSEGVLEHFTPKDQDTIIKEALRVLKAQGKSIMIVPNRKAPIYNFFRLLSMKLKTWPFGYEEPLTVEDFNKFSYKPIAFHSSGWMVCQFRHIFVPGITQVIAILANFLEHALKSKLASIEKSSPGVILAAVWVK